MAEIYVRSSDGDDADSGATWALAKATLAGAAAIDVKGDFIYLSSSHAETGGTANFAYTAPSQFLTIVATKIISANDAAEPPTSATAGALFSLGTGAYSHDWRGSLYAYGLTLETGDGFFNTDINLNSYTSAANSRQTWEQCTFRIRGTGSASALCINAAGAASNTDVCFTKWINCSFKTAANQPIENYGHFVWEGGEIEAGTVSLTNLFRGAISGRGAVYEISGVDLQNLATTTNIFLVSGSSQMYGTIKDCRLPASWTGSLISTGMKAVGRFSMYNCDSGDTNYRLWIEDFTGSIKDETTIVKSGGASDGTTPIAWKMTGSASCDEWACPLFTDNIPLWVDTTTSKTVEIDFIHDGTTNLQNDEVWLEVSYPGDASYPTASFARDKRANVLAAPADHASSGATWTTTGLTNPNKQKLSVTFTPQNKGVCYVRVALAKASQTIYVDPKPTVT